MAEREQRNQLRTVRSGEFNFSILKKGNLFYIALGNGKEKMRNGKGFRDEAYQDKQLASLYGSSSGSKSQQAQGASQAFGMNMTSNPFNYKVSRKRRCNESSSFTRRQLEYLHLQFVSLVTSNVNAQLTKKPNLDIKSSIAGLERTIDMMCDISYKSPSVFLQAFQPLRMPDSTRRMVEKCLE